VNKTVSYDLQSGLKGGPMINLYLVFDLEIRVYNYLKQNYISICFSLLKSRLEIFGHKSTPSNCP